MFRISEIWLDEQQHFKLKNQTLIYGQNTVGKTLFFRMIDFLMGHGKPDIWSAKGLENVSYATMSITDGQKKAVFRRNRDGECYFCLFSENLSFEAVSLSQYKDRLSSLFVRSSKDFSTKFEEIVGEVPTYRSFSYLNFLDENSIGNTAVPYAEANDSRFAKRIRNQMAFLFDPDTLKELLKCQSEISQLEKDIQIARSTLTKRELLREQIEEGMKKLGLQTSGEVGIDQDVFSSYLQGEKSSVNKGKQKHKELIFLLTMDAELENQIKLNEIMKGQDAKIQSEVQQNILLMSLLSDALGNDEKYTELLSTVNGEISKAKNEFNILSVKDYDGTIASLKQKRASYADKLRDLRLTSSSISYMDKEVIVKNIEESFQLLNSLAVNGDVYSKEEQLKTKRKEYKNLILRFRGNQNPILNQSMTDSYLQIKGLSCVAEDEKRRVSLSFDPNAISILAKEIVSVKKEEGKKIDEVKQYLPGSKARHACWQAVLFVEMIHFLLKKQNGVPVPPLLVIDGLLEPFDDDSSHGASLYELLKRKCSEYNIQLIVFTSKMADYESVDINMSHGFNANYHLVSSF